MSELGIEAVICVLLMNVIEMLLLLIPTHSKTHPLA